MSDKDIALEEEIVEEKQKTSKKSEPAKKVAKKFTPGDSIPCKSVTAGELVLIGLKSKLKYSWADYGDVSYVEYQDLQALQSMKSGFLVKPRFIIEDEDLVEQWGSMLKPIYDKIDNQDVEALLKINNPIKFRVALAKMPEGLKETIKTKAIQMIKSEELYDIRIIKIIDEVLHTEFATILG